uniref:Uncharacterized protein n=1 Tax=Kuenenia stuttgartiensis TaxID=174633 RepID=Q1Q1F5_KUEST|nr:unknown protein [Candidatus Kuenenia stuttgartiensis]
MKSKRFPKSINFVFLKVEVCCFCTWMEKAHGNLVVLTVHNYTTHSTNDGQNHLRG